MALATSAAPTYFPVQEIDSVQYVDGGLYANNPVLVGITEAVFNGYWIKPKEERGDEDFDGVQILSISSCVVPKGDYAKRKRRSFMRWISTLFDDYGEGQSKSNDFFIKQILPHLDFEIEIKRIENNPISCIQAKKVTMDNASKASLSILKGIGSVVGNIAKNDSVVKKLYTEKKNSTLDGKIWKSILLCVLNTNAILLAVQAGVSLLGASAADQYAYLFMHRLWSLLFV